jgi:hypothetical protein
MACSMCRRDENFIKMLVLKPYYSESLSTSVESKRSPIDRVDTKCRSTQIDQCKCTFSASVRLKRLVIDHVETRRRSTQIDQCKRAFSTSVESKHSSIDHVETRFQFSVLVMWLKSCDQPM